MAHTFTIVKQPVISEKSMLLAQRGWYTFAVRKTARKESIAAEIARLYSVRVTEVRTVRMPGKTRRAGKAMRTVTRPDWKKAMVKLAKGQHIPVFEVSQQEGAKA